MLNELINMHKEITEIITFKTAVEWSFITIIIFWIFKYAMTITFWNFKYGPTLMKHNEFILTKDLRRNALLIIKEIGRFINSIIISIFILLGVFNEKIFSGTAIKLYGVVLVISIIKRIINLLITKGYINDGNV